MDNELIHLAVVLDDGIPPAAEKKAILRSAAGQIATFGRILGTAVSLLPKVKVVSFFSPELQVWAADPSLSLELYDTCSGVFDDLSAAAGSVGGRLQFLGRIDDLPPPWPKLASLPLLPEQTITTNFFLNYSGRQELVEATRKHLDSIDPPKLSEESFSSLLYTAGQPDPDLIIYAGGSFEPKDFLLWQASYSEIWHAPTKGSDFSSADLAEALENFFTRQRRFGGV